MKAIDRAIKIIDKRSVFVPKNPGWDQKDWPYKIKVSLNVKYSALPEDGGTIIKKEVNESKTFGGGSGTPQGIAIQFADKVYKNISSQYGKSYSVLVKKCEITVEFIDSDGSVHSTLKGTGPSGTYYFNGRSISRRL